MNISPVIVSAAKASGTLNGAFAFQINASDPVTGYSASDLPPGLFLNSSTGLISGTPSMPGTFNATIGITNAGGSADDTLQITIDPVLEVVLNGLGTVTTGFAGVTSRVPGQSYSITATLKKGYYFAGWTGGITSDSQTLTFVMSGNLNLQANFDRFVPQKGSYFGLISGSLATVSGAITLSITPTGSFSVVLNFGGTTYHVAGRFDSDGVYTGEIRRSGQLPITYTLVLDSVAGTVDGSFVLNGSTLSSVTAERNAGSRAATPQNYYTILFLPNPAQPPDAAPPGYGYGTATVDSGGAIRFAGVLADGHKVSQGTALTTAGQWPFYVQPYPKGGLLSGMLTFETIVGQSDIDGTLDWLKMANGADTLYRGGFDIAISGLGSRYTSLGNTPVLPFSTGVVSFADGNLSATAPSETVTINGRNEIILSGSSKFSMKLSAASGLFSGAFRDPVTKKSRQFSGALFQDQGLGEGFFLGNGQGGSVSFTPAP